MKMSCYAFIVWILLAKFMLLSHVSCNFHTECIDDRLIVTVFDVNMSDVVKIECTKEPKFIEIFAINKLTVDADIDKSGLNVQLSIIAPIWEIVGVRKFVLNGAHAVPQPSLNITSVGDGRNGRPGQPGGSAGTFFGIGMQFLNDVSLNIFLIGGNGSSGQNGLNGKKN